MYFSDKPGNCRNEKEQLSLHVTTYWGISHVCQSDDDYQIEIIY
jgi:hypothetical protein